MSPTIVAHYLTLKFQLDGIPITPLKLQKVLYYIQAWHATIFESENVFNELPEAWVNGPAYRSVYNQYKSKFARNTPIVDKELSGANLVSATKDAYSEIKIASGKKGLMNAVVQKYGALADEKLVYLTHVETPWNNARKGLKPFQSGDVPISIADMVECYGKRVANGK